MSHTPGPWTANDDPGAGWQIKAKVPQLRDVDHPVTIYHVDKPSERMLIGFAPWVQFPKDFIEEMFAANSRLIAAAPDLLAGCKAALGAFERNDAINWDDLRLAIEKAEGKAMEKK